MKIKRLENDLAKATAKNGDAVVPNQSAAKLLPENKYLNKAAIFLLLNTLDRLIIKPYSIAVVTAFKSWRKTYTGGDSQREKEKMAKELEASIQANAAMEQRIAKLKALLARTHQANQRNLEEFDNLKKTQKEAEGEMRSIDMKKDAELKSLKEVVRASSITNAFQYDIDILIQNAADSMISKQKTMMQDAESNPARLMSSTVVKELEEENSRLKKTINEVLAKENSFDSELESMTKRHEKEAQMVLELKQKNGELSDTLMKLRSDLQDQQCLRKELELELQHLSSDRYGMLEDRKHSKDLESQLADTKVNLNTCERKLKQSETLSERLTKENKMLKIRVQDFTKIQTENTNLTLRLNELKSRGDASSSSSANNSNSVEVVELTKRNLNSLVSNAHRLEDSLRSSRSYCIKEFTTINLRHTLIMDLTKTQGSLVSLLNIARRSYENIFRELSLEAVEFINIVRDPIVGLQQVLGVLDTALEDKLGELMSVDEQLRLLKEGANPLEMSWESSTENVAASREKLLPLYGTSSPLPTTLHWSYSGDACECIALQLRYSCPPYVDKITKLSSTEKTGGDGKPVFTGSYYIGEGHGDVILTLINESLWSDAYIAYHFGLTSDMVENNENIAILSQAKLDVDEKLKRLQILVDASKDIMRRLSNFMGEMKEMLEKKCHKNGKVCDSNYLSNMLFNQLGSNSLYLVRLIGSINNADKKLTRQVDSQETIDSAEETKSTLEESNDVSVEGTSLQETTLSVSSGVVSYSAESVKIKAQSDMRITLPPQKGRVRISWDFQVIGKGTIGFTVGKLMPDGQVPLLIPYVRTQERTRSSVSSIPLNQAAIVGYETFELEALTTIVVFFDNTFSWINAKNIKYNITVENFSEGSNLDMMRSAVITRSTNDMTNRQSIINESREGDPTEFEREEQGSTAITLSESSQNDSNLPSDVAAVAGEDPCGFENEVRMFLEICRAELLEIEISVLTLCRN